MIHRCNFVFLSTFILLLAIPGRVSSEQVTILRDRWGVPRILGDSMEAVAHGFGYAQAEDRLEEILRHYLLAEGRMASAFGPGAIEGDLQQARLRHREVSRARYGDLSRRARRSIEAFIGGIRRYMEEHPEKVPDWAPRPEPYHVIALTRFAVWGWPVGEAFADLGRAPRRLPGSGSNQWALSPERTAPGCSISCIDPHVGLEGLLRWYEAHLHGGPLHAYGFALAGTPLIALGHNDHLSWACTTGGPDTSDIYEVELDPGDPGRYRYDGRWRKVESLQVEIPVRRDNRTSIEKRTIRRTHHGPILREVKGRVFAMKIPYEEEVGLIDQILAFNLARNLNDFRAALELNQFFPQNLMVADVDGNIFYIRTGRVPIRPPGLDTSRPLPGNTSKTEWLGFHRQAELVQCLNPPQGFFQNCNIAPDTMMPGSPMTLDRYGPILFNAAKDGTNPRGRRAVELLSRADRLTVDQAIAICLDTGVWGYRGWLAALEESLKAHPAGSPGQEKKRAGAARLLLGWDGHMEADSEAATLYFAWKKACRKIEPRASLEVPPGRPGREEKIKIARAFDQALQTLEENFGSYRVPWGRINRLRRGERSFPVSGASPKWIGISTLRAIGTREGPDHTLTQVSGQTCPTVVILRGPGDVVSYSAIPFGESDDPASPHYTDQAEKLYSPKRLKDSRYRKEGELEGVESRKVLDVPGELTRGEPPPEPSPVSLEEVEQLARLTATPHKLGRPVLAPTGRTGDFDSKAVDCPNVFGFQDRWYMTYIGFDGTGYRTGLASSDDLIRWKREGMILDRGKPGAFDAHGAAGLSILGNNELFSAHEPYRVRGRYWLSYYGNDAPGYEAGYGSIGLASSRDLKNWTRFEKNPILSPRDGGAWEKGTLYKSFLLRGPGGNFALLYNAKNSLGGPWVESTGLATSPDLKTWTRHPSNPVLPHGPAGAWDSSFASDPIVFHHGDLYVMFYYGYDGRHAQDGLAASRDLIRWTKLPRPILGVGPPGSMDSLHAHKPSVVWRRGAFYHFYCSVRDRDHYRAITMASSRPME